MNSTKIALFTLTMNRLEYTQKMLASLDRFTHMPFDHVVVDNGSTDGTVEFLHAMRKPNVKVIFNADNKGIPIACNQALDLIGDGYDFIIKIDNDCEILADDWLAPSIKVIDALERKVILSPRIKGLGKLFPDDGMPRYSYTRAGKFTIGLARHLGGICVVSPAEAYQNFRFPLTDSLHGVADINFSYHAQKRGYSMGYIEQIEAAHMDTSFGQIQKFPAYFEKRMTDEKGTVYGESRLMTRIKRPYRRAMFIKKMRYLGLEKHGVVRHAVGKAGKVVKERLRREQWI